MTESLLDWERSAAGLYVPAREKRPTAVDLFCGCGGFSLGIEQAGFDVLCGVEWDCDAAQTYMVNLGAYPIDLRFVEAADRDRLEKSLKRKMKPKNGVAQAWVSGSNRTGGTGVPVFWFGDIRKLSGAQILDSIDLAVGELDLIVGGPPCQGFSVAGKRNVMDPRNSLVFDFARLVCEMKPRAFCMENVPGMLSMVTETGASVIDELCRIFERGNYGEYEAMRAVLTGDRKIVSRGAGVRSSRKTKAAPAESDAASSTQVGLFDVVRNSREDGHGIDARKGAT